MKLALIQTNIKDYDIEENMKTFSCLLDDIQTDTDLVVLPEMFLTGFIADTSYAKDSRDLGLKLMQDFNKRTHIAIEGSLIIEEDTQFFNRHYFVAENISSHYDKFHLFSLSDEAKVLSKGKNQDVIIEYNGLKIKMLTCYDLRFPLASMNSIYNNMPRYDVLVYVASWPKSRREQWLTLLKARAIENQCFVVAVNRQGEDAMGTKYSGDSMVIDNRGRILDAFSTHEGQVLYFEISKEKLDKDRRYFPLWMDWPTTF